MKDDSLLIRCSAAIVSLTLVGSVAAADAVGWPPPGQYFIDSEATMTMGAGMQRVTRTEGTTGKQTTTVLASGSPPQTMVFNIGKPNTWCVHARNGGPPPGMPVCPTTRADANAAGSSFSASCQGMAMESQFRQIDARTWEHTFKVDVTNAAAPSQASREAMLKNVPGLTPAQRAQAQAGIAAMPDMAAKRDAALAQLRDELTQQAKSGNAEEAAAAREQLQAFERATGGARGGVGTPLQSTSVKERWTLTGRPCDAGQ